MHFYAQNERILSKNEANLYCSGLLEGAWRKLSETSTDVFPPYSFLYVKQYAAIDLYKHGDGVI